MDGITLALVGIAVWQIARMFGNAVNEAEGLHGEKLGTPEGRSRPEYMVAAVLLAAVATVLLIAAVATVYR